MHGPVARSRAIGYDPRGLKPSTHVNIVKVRRLLRDMR